MSVRKLGFLLFMLCLSAIGLSSCTAPCDYPTQRFAKLRLVNAMPDVDKVTFWINDKLMYADYPYDPPQDFPFGYFVKFADGTPLSIGKQHIVVTRDAAGKDTLMADTTELSLHRATVVAIGRGNAFPSEKNTKKLLTLDDELRSVDPDAAYIRLIHAVPDLTDLDIYWKERIVPDATIQYGIVNPYNFLDSVKSLRITEAGNFNNVISLIPFPFVTGGGFLLTAIIRGRTAPIDHEHVASVFVLSDIELGNSIINFETFGVRMVNALRDPQTKTSLLIRSSPTTDIRNNFPNQSVVLDIAHNSTSGYLALNPVLNKDSKYYFSTTNSFPFALVDSVAQSAVIDDRYTFVAFDSSKLGSSTPGIDHVVLKDTISSPTNTAFNRVRLVMLNADENGVVVSLGGASKAMNVKDVAYFDVATGSQELKLGTDSQSVTIGSGRPMTIYLLPAQVGERFPIKAVME